jgi:hypothetical protein
MNDYERLVEDLDQAIATTETAYYNAQDEEDQALIDEALDKLKAVKERAGARV